MKIRNKELQERQKFLQVYTEFNQWLEDLGFRPAHYWKEASTHLDVNYWSDEKDKHYFDSLYGVECYINDALNYKIRFMRHRYEHKFTQIGDMMSRTEDISLDEFKQFLAGVCREIKAEMLSKLEKIKV